MTPTTRWRRAWAALRQAETPPAPEAPGGPEAALARARLDLDEARREIERLREEYTRRDQRAAAEAEAAARDGLVRLMRRVGPLFSQLVTMQAHTAQGRAVRSEDLLTLTAKLQHAFAEAGMAAIGEVGAEAAFNPKLHQRMSGGDLEDGAPVCVRFVGYACGDTVLTKAMVSRREP